jgi:sodium/hydrogen antiporter
LIGPLGLKLVEPEVREQAQLIESLGEIAVAVCLFCVGLRLRAAFEWPLWRAPVRLATVTMVGTLIIAASAAHLFFDLSFPESLLLGAILAPTDPVLASDMRLGTDDDLSSVRFSLAAEGAFNSGMAYPAVVFSLGQLGLHDSGPLGLRWLALDVVWSIAIAVVIGWIAGLVTSRTMTRIDTSSSHSEGSLSEVLLVLACGAIAYLIAIAVHSYGFLAVLTAGIALTRKGKLRALLQPQPRLPRYIQRTALRVEHLAELAMVIVLGVLLANSGMRPAMFLFALLLLLVARPLAVRVGLARLQMPEGARRLVEWFGVRGIASVYYLMHSINEGLSAPFARELTAIVLAVLVTSIVIHSLSSSLSLLPRHLKQES